MWRTKRTPRPPRVLVAVTVAMVVLAASGCTRPKAKANSDQKAMDTITQEIQTTLAQKPDVVQAKVGYQNTVDAYQRTDVSIALKPGTDLEPVIDEATRLIWQSKLNPLSSITIGVVYDQSDQRGTTRRIDAVKDKADLDGKYGPHPTK
jgi:hypothetical protein